MESVLVVLDENSFSSCDQLKKSGVKNIEYIQDLSQLSDENLKKFDAVLIPSKKLIDSFKIPADNQKELDFLKFQNQKLQNKLEEIRLIDRAKCVLIQYLNMTEQQAHRYIEKQSMDLRQSRVVTAESILKTYES